MDDIYEYVSNKIYELHRTNNKPRKFGRQSLKWLKLYRNNLHFCNCTLNAVDLSKYLIIITKYCLFDKYQNLLKQYQNPIQQQYRQLLWYIAHC